LTKLANSGLTWAWPEITSAIVNRNVKDASFTCRWLIGSEGESSRARIVKINGLDRALQPSVRPL